MRLLGLLGGMSWESTAEYYRLLNRGVAEHLADRFGLGHLEGTADERGGTRRHAATSQST